MWRLLWSVGPGVAGEGMEVKVGGAGMEVKVGAAGMEVAGKMLGAGKEGAPVGDRGGEGMERSRIRVGYGGGCSSRRCGLRIAIR